MAEAQFQTPHDFFQKRQPKIVEQLEIVARFEILKGTETRCWY